MCIDRDIDPFPSPRNIEQMSLLAERGEEHACGGFERKTSPEIDSLESIEFRVYMHVCVYI